MNWIDIAALAFLALGFVFGFVRRIGWEFLRLLLLPACCLAAGKLTGFTRGLIEKFYELAPGFEVDLAPWFAAFLLTYVIGIGVLGVLRRRRDRSGGRYEGGVLGIARSALLLAMLFAIVVFAGPDPLAESAYGRAVRDSTTGRTVTALIEKVPEELVPKAYFLYLEDRLGTRP